MHNQGLVVQEFIEHVNMVKYEEASHVDTPRSYNEAIRGPNRKKWDDSMKTHLDALAEENTWMLVLYPDKNKIVMISVWKYRVKTEHGKITNLKSHLCVDGKMKYMLLLQDHLH